MQAETGGQTTTPNEEQPPLHSAMDIPNTNGTAAVGAGSLAQTQPPTHTPPAQTKPRYGTWMLVTRKNHQATEFGILADLHDHADAPARNNNTVNDNSMSRPLPRARSKSPMHTHVPQSSVRSPQPTSTTDQPVNPQATRMGSRGRGGRAGNNRGRGRGEGRGLPGNASNPALESSAIHWNAQYASTLFQFGNNQPAADRLTSFNPNQFPICALNSDCSQPQIRRVWNQEFLEEKFRTKSELILKMNPIYKEIPCGIEACKPIASGFPSGSGFDRFLHQLTQIEANWLGRMEDLPASKAAIESMPTIEILDSHIEIETHCAICKEPFELGNEAREMPCNHLYYFDCILPLSLRNSFPFAATNSPPTPQTLAT
nr:probable E3 ubiquitin-protein ligase RHC2A [Ipomoea batatas]